MDTYGVTVSATKSASVVASWSAISLTGASSRTIAFKSISGNLYTNSACTSSASVNTKYTNQTFYYRSDQSRPSATYVYSSKTSKNKSSSSTFKKENEIKSLRNQLLVLYPNRKDLVWTGTWYEEDSDGDSRYLAYCPYSNSSESTKYTKVLPVIETDTL